jgi:dienelactone hydrolase
MTISRWAVLLGLVPVAAGAPLRAQEAVGAMLPGPWPVGFTRLARADSARPLPGGEPRPLDIGVWFPARAPGPSHLTLRTYFPLGGAEESTALAAFLVAHGAPDSAVAAWLDAPMLATADPPPAGDRFPLVLVAQGNGQTVQDQAPLAEYLASHGYVVATSPSPTRITGPLTDERSVGSRAEEQARDLAFVRATLADRADLDGGRIGLVAHSFGARGALLLAMQDSSVAALVSLDGGIGTATARQSFESATSFNASATRTPVLHFYERLDGFMAPDFGLLRSLGAADRWVVEVPSLHHHHFTNLGAAGIDHPSLRSATGATGATARAYASVADATLAFLDAFLKGDRTARARFEPGVRWPELGPLERLRR